VRLAIHHLTTYAYSSPAAGATQLLRLRPRDGARQRVLSWRVRSPGSASRWIDHHGNEALLLALAEPAARIEIHAEGEVETSDALESASPLPAGAYLRATPLTVVDAALRALAAPFAGQDVAALCEAVADAVTYTPGASDVATTAAAALARGAGVCQDQAHVLVACCRALGIPARYVSGYLHADGEVATHAWAEALGARGWVGYDPANRLVAGERHVVLAYGLDYLDAAPVRGWRVGGGDERLAVAVTVGRSEQ
jgi:transglutaminase-like putative cysteine protease